MAKFKILLFFCFLTSGMSALQINLQQIMEVVEQFKPLINIFDNLINSPITIGELVEDFEKVVRPEHIHQVLETLIQHLEMDPELKQVLRKKGKELDIPKLVRDALKDSKDVKMRDVTRMVKSPNFPVVAAEKSYEVTKTVLRQVLNEVSKEVSSKFSEPCRHYVLEYFQSVIYWNMTSGPNGTWSEFHLRLFDSTPKEMSHHKILHKFGNYLECTTAEHPDGIAVGQYCTIRSLPKNQGPRRLFDQSPTRGVCVPSTCSEAELREVIQEYLSTNDTTKTIPQGACARREKPYKQQSNLSMSIFLCLLGLILISSILDSDFSLEEDSWLKKASKLFSLADCAKDLRVKETVLKFFPGLACLSFIHLALIMEITTSPLKPLRNYSEFVELTRSWWNAVLLQPIPLDTFFFIASTSIATNIHTNQKQYFRFIKPVLKHVTSIEGFVLAALILMAPMYLRYSDGFWAFYAMDIGYNNCKSMFLKKVFFIDNFTGESHKCWPHLTHFSVAVQWLVITPLLIYLMQKFKNVSTKLIGLLLAACSAITFFTVYVNKLPPSYLAGGLVDYHEKVQVQAPTRGAAWLIGLWLGNKIREEINTKFRMKFSKLELIFGWGLATLLAMASLFWIAVFDLHSDEFDPFHSAAYTTIQPILWILSLTWTTYAFFHGDLNIVGKMLSSALFSFVYKLWKGALTVYYAYIVLRIGFDRNHPYFGFFYWWDDFIFNTTVSSLAGYFLYITLDRPLQKIFDLIFEESPPQAPKKAKKEKRKGD